MKKTWKILVIVFLIELGYFMASRHISRALGWDSINGEIIRTFLRLITAFADYALLHDLITSRRLRKIPISIHWLPLAGAATFLMAAIVLGKYGLPTKTGYIFATTSIFVAMKEEILFRGIVLNSISKLINERVAIFLSSLVFTIWHIGMVNPDPWNFIQILLASTFLGFIYVGTGSLLVAILLHATYDAIFSLSPIIEITSRTTSGLILLSLSLAIVIVWFERSQRSYQPQSEKMAE